MVSGRVSESHMASKEPSMDKASKEKAMEKASKESIMEKTSKEEKAFKQPTMEKASKEPNIEKKPTMKKTSEEKKASKQSDVEKKPTMEKASKEPTTEEKLTMEKKSTIAKASKEPTMDKKPTMDMVSKESTIDKASESTLPISSNLRASSSADSSSVESSLSSSITGTSSVKTSSVSGTIRDSVNSDAKTSEGKYRNGRKMSETADSDKSGSFISDSNESISSSSNSAASKPHKTNDSKWEAIRAAIAKYGVLGLNHFKLLKRLGCGDIGSVYLCELRRTNSCFAMKVMDKGSLASRKKLLRAQTEREILQLLDHPFLPTLYAHFETDKYSCLVMEFCSGGDLHTLRQRQPGKYFPECIARFYAAEVLLALEYLHMMGIVYRDLKPENVLVREDGHIMLTDFDLSLRCTASPTLVKSSSISDTDPSRRGTQYCVRPPCVEPLCIPPSCIAPPCIRPNFFMPKRLLSKLNRKPKNDASNQATNTTTNSLPELMVEPIEARSMSFVGTHEYLAPEIIKGEGHGSAVDWWTFGIFLYELLHGKTPFKGDGNRATLFNVVGQPLKFPESPSVSFGARDLIRGLMVKDPKYRLASKRGAVEIRQHPFFEGVNWALIRSMRPPEVPRHFDLELARSQSQHGSTSSSVKNRGSGANSTSSMSYLDFEF